MASSREHSGITRIHRDAGRRLAGRVRNLPIRLGLAAARIPATRWFLRLFVDFGLDPYDPAFRADPYPFYQRLRERAPVYWSPFGIWLISGFGEAMTVLTDPRFAHPDYRAEARRRERPNLLRLMHSNMFISQNPPDHTRLRRIVGQAFASQQSPELRSRIQAVATRLLDRVDGARRMDAIADFALPLPVTVIADLFGMPFADAVRCQVWVRQAADAIELAPSAAKISRAEEATKALAVYFQRLIQERRVRPTGDLISALVRAQEIEDLADDEVVASCILVFGAGHETTVAFLGTAIHTLLRHRGAWEQLQADERLIPNGVDELLRYEAPLQFFGRQAQEDVVLGGKRIRRGQTLMVLAGAVNRDPARFHDPDRVELRRSDGQHTSFGHGIHACIGQGLARLEGHVALETLIRRLPGLRLGDEAPVWRDNVMFRALDMLFVTW